MKNNKFIDNMFLPILSIFLLVVFVLTTFSFASDNSSQCPVCEEELILFYPDGISSIILTNDGSGKHVNNMFLVKLDNEYYIVVTCSYSNVHGNEKLYINNNNLSTSPSCYMYAYFKYSNNSWNYIGYDNNFVSNIIQNATFISSTTDIYTDDTFSDYFFQSAPLGITKTLVEETTKVQITEQLKIMIAGFLKYLIVFVISVIAFWNGWQFLSTQLRKA